MLGSFIVHTRAREWISLNRRRMRVYMYACESAIIEQAAR